MHAANNTPLAASDRPLPLVARADLVATAIRLRGETSWTLKDSVSLEYFQLTHEQYAVLKLLDGSRSVRQLRTDFLREFPATRPSLQEMQQLAFDLFDKGLAYSTRAGQGEALAGRGRERRRKQLQGALGSLLYIRLPGFDPGFLLGVFSPIARWMFHPLAAAGGAMLVLSVWLMLLVRFQDVLAQLPDAASLTTVGNLLLLWITLGVAKLLHELGHALACKHFGGECHEVGVALLVFSPCLYCDVSDTATFPSRVKRMAVGAAGMYVELVLSALAAIVWWHVEPGMLRNLCLSLFLVTNISTIAFNLNPLLRFDGYYLLCDWLETPNLRQRAAERLNRTLGKHLAGVLPPEPPHAASLRSGWLMGYALASGLYRWMFLLVVTLSLYAMLKPYGLGSLGLLLGGVAAIAGLVQTGLRLWRFIDAHRNEIVESQRPRVTVVAFVTILVAMFFVPLPLSVEAPLVVQPAGIRHVYVTTPGRLEAVYVEPGERVAAGQLLAVLDNPAKRDHYETLRTAARAQQVEVAVHQATGDAAAQASAAKTFRALYEEGRDYHQQLVRLSLVAPCAGVIVAPPPPTTKPTPTHADRLPRLQNSPLDDASLGAQLDKGTHLLSIAPDDGSEAVLKINQASRGDFTEGAAVRMQFNSLPGEVVRGVVTNVTQWTDQPESHRQGADPNSANRYQARVTIDSACSPLITGMSGVARVWVTHRTTANWLWRQFRLTFNSHL